MAQSDVYGLRKAVTKQVDLTIEQYNGTAKDGEILVDMNPGNTQYMIFVGMASGYVTGLTANSALSANVANYAANVTAAAQPNITAVGTLVGLDVAGDVGIAGNVEVNGDLNVTGNISYINVVDLQIQDPIIFLGGGANGAPLTANDGKDRGTQLQVFDTGAGAPVPKFMGWKDSAGEFVLGSNVTNAADVITVNTYGNLRAGTIFVDGLSTTGNISAFDISASNTVSATVDVTAGGSVSAVLDVTAGGNVDATGNVTAGINVDAVADVTAGGNVAAVVDVTAGANVSAGIDVTAGGNVSAVVDVTAGSNVSAVLDVTAGGNVDAVGNVTAGINVAAVADVTAGGNVAAIVDVTAGANIAAGVDVTAGANISAVQEITAGGNIAATGNVGGLNVTAVANVSAGNVSATANISSANLTVAVGNVDFTTTANVSLGAVANLHVSGGVSGQVLRTDGAGVLSWVDANTAPGGAGSNTQVVFNDAGVMGAVSTFTYDKATNILSVGNVSLTANLSVAGEVLTDLIPNGNKVYDLGNATNRWGNIYLSNNSLYLGAVHVTSDDVSVVNIPNVATANLAATGNVVAANITANVDITATGNISAGNLSTGGDLSVTGNIAATGNVDGGNLVTSGTVNAFDITVTDAYVTANITVTDTMTVSNIVTTGSNVDFTTATTFTLGSNIFVLPSETVFQADAFASRAETGGSATFDCGTADFFQYTVTGAITLAATNVPAAGRLCSIIVELVNGGSAAVTYFAGTKWASGTPPTLTAAGTDILGFYTVDGGTSWVGLVLGLNIS